MKYVTEYDRKLRTQSETFESRLINVLESNQPTDELYKEAVELKKNGYLTPSEFKVLTDFDLYREML